MNKPRLWIFGALLPAIAIVAVSWFAGISPRLSEARTADEERATVAALNATHEAKLAELEALSAELPALQTELAGLKLSVPADAAIADLLGQLDAMAVRTGTRIVDFRADASTAFGSEAPPAGTAPAGEPAAAAAGAAGASLGSSSFVAVPVSVSVSGDPAGYTEFFRLAQSGLRLFLVTDIEITYDGTESKATVSGQVFVLQSAAEAAATPVPGSVSTPPAEQEAQAQQ